MTHEEAYRAGYQAGRLSMPEIVHCKDCRWWDKKEGSHYGYCQACQHGYSSGHWEIGIYRSYRGDFFCADGERKEGVHE